MTMKAKAHTSNKAKCKAYKDYGIRLKNKEKKQARHLKKMARFKARREAKAA